MASLADETRIGVPPRICEVFLGVAWPAAAPRWLYPWFNCSFQDHQARMSFATSPATSVNRNSRSRESPKKL